MVTTALLIFFWAVVPGLITGWMLRERGRSFLPGLLLGALFGPLGILGVLAFIYVADRRRARGRGHGRGRAVRVFYDIPLVGRLHVSTVWALAGVATFLCLWMIGGITYEAYRAELNSQATPEQAKQTAAEPAQPNSLLPANTPSEQQTPETRLPEQAQVNPANQARSALLGNISGQPGEPAAGAQPPGNSATSWQPTPPPAGNAAPPAPGAPAVAAAGTPQPTNAQPAPPTPKAPASSRSEAVAEVTRDLASRGHRVHAAVSGDAQTATLSLSGATLTREAGNQILGNGRLRGTLKAAGVRIVVMMNGEQSWTYML
jgi:cytoskeletal protein RodZ